MRHPSSRSISAFVAILSICSARTVSAQALFDHWGGILTPKAKEWRSWSVEVALHSEFNRCNQDKSTKETLLRYAPELFGRDSGECKDDLFLPLIKKPGDTRVGNSTKDSINVDSLFRIGSLDKTLGYNLLRYDHQVRVRGDDIQFDNLFWHTTWQVGWRGDQVTEFLQNDFAHKGIQGRLGGHPLSDVPREGTYTGAVAQFGTEHILFLPVVRSTKEGLSETGNSPFYVSVQATAGTEFWGGSGSVGIADYPIELWIKGTEWMREVTHGLFGLKTFGVFRTGVQNNFGILGSSPFDSAQLSDTWTIFQAGLKLETRLPECMESTPISVSAAWTQHSGLFTRTRKDSYAKEGLRTLLGTLVIEAPHFQFVLVNDNPNETDGGASFAAALRYPFEVDR